MKKYLAFVLALVMSLSLVACGGGGAESSESGEKVVKIGVFEPQTGDNGTMMFTVFGILAMAGAAAVIVLASRKKRNAA